MTNDTDSNIQWHSEYNGDRVPIDDRGTYTLYDRPYALGSHDPLWTQGSVNRAVKALYDARGGVVDSSDQEDYDNGVMDIYTIRKYIDMNCLYGLNGDAQNTVPMDMMCFRGYPTYSIRDIRYTNIELNQGMPLESVSLTSDIIPFQTKESGLESLPVTPGANYVLITGEIQLNSVVPFDSIYIALKQMISINGHPAYSGDFEDESFACKTECFGDGSGIDYEFMFYAEMTEEAITDGTVTVSLTDNNLDSYSDDAMYILSGIPNYGDAVINATYDGSKWIGESAVGVDTTAPSPPTNIIVGNSDNITAWVSWDEVIVDIGIKYYRIFFGEQEAISTTLSHSFYALRGTEYEVTVYAVDYADNESEVSSTVLYTIPDNPLEIVLHTAGDCDAIADTELHVQDTEAFLKGMDCVLYLDINGENVFQGGDNTYTFQHPYEGDKYSMIINDEGKVTGYNPCKALV